MTIWLVAAYTVVQNPHKIAESSVHRTVPKPFAVESRGFHQNAQKIAVCQSI